MKELGNDTSEFNYRKPSINRWELPGGRSARKFLVRTQNVWRRQVFSWRLLNRSEYLLDSVGTDGLSSPVRTQCKAKNVKLFKFLLQVLCVINVITENQIDLPWTCFSRGPWGFRRVPQGSRPPCLIGSPASLLITHIKSLNWANYSDCKTVMSSGDASVPRL